MVEVITYKPLTSRSQAPRKEVKERVTVHRYEWFDSGSVLVSERLRALELPLLFPGLFLATLFFLLRNHRKIDLIHSHGFVAGSIANLLSPIFRKPYVLSVHWIIGKGRLSGTKTLLNRLLSRACVVLALSKAAQEEEAKTLGLPEEKIHRFKYWVDLARFRPEDKKSCKRTVGVETRTLVLYVGRLVQEKGVLTILEIARHYQNRSDVVFGIIGKGPLEDEVKNQCELYPNLVFFGGIPNEHLPPYYNSADLVIVPSIHEEGYGRVIMESLSCGVPVLASNRGGIPEVLDETVGVICDPNLSSITHKLDVLLSDPRFLDSLAQRCREFSVRNFGLKNAHFIDQAYTLALSMNSDQ
jgi:glycosyltransferase involved in cell wall biosynthesis